MLTSRHLDIYESFAGDLDAWVRAGNDAEMSADEWRLIEEFLQGLSLIHADAASPAFAARLSVRLNAETEGERVIARLRALGAGSK